MGSVEWEPPRYPQITFARGYRYQDLVAAILLARSVVEPVDTVAIESARFARDRFDDVSVQAGTSKLRLQAKQSTSRVVLTENRFTGDDERLKIEDLVHGYSLDPDPGTQLRLFASWHVPEETNRVGFLVPASAPSVIAGAQTSRWHLDANGIWPVTGRARWSPLRDADRADFVAFCERFVLELEAPAMSGSIADPGTLERLLIAILVDQAGVNRHPNRRDPVDVASRLIDLATSARARDERVLTATEIERELGLIVERGRLAQAFPLDQNRYVEAPLRARLDAVVGHVERVLVTGPPGAGKSWALESFAEDLRNAGYVVARHYCFLEPGDPDVQERVALETMSSNLIAELLDHDSLQSLHVGLARDVPALADVVRRAVVAIGLESDDGNAAAKQDPEGEVSNRAAMAGIVLIVDGIDHVARVEREGVAPVRPDDFANALAALELPTGVTLVVGSQPGRFLDPLLEAGAHEIEAPPFDAYDTARQLVRLGVFRELRQRGLGGERRSVLIAVTEQSAGNPLYSRFLGLQVRDALQREALVSPAQLVEDLPVAMGDLRGYYEYLLAGTETAPDAGYLAERLAVIDFAVSLHDLVQLLPELGRGRIDAALRHLRPILLEMSGQGGVRIHHESLRRFVVERLEAEERPLSVLLDPIIVWLTALGFYDDERSFRYLLPALRRASRSHEILTWLPRDSLAESIIALHPRAAVDANVRLGARVAADARDFSALARLVELRRAVATAYEEKLGDLSTYAQAVIDVHGAQTLSERLLFEGRPVYDRATGLGLCALVDDAGGTAPWEQYVRLPDRSGSGNYRTNEQWVSESLDEFQAMTRLRSREQMISRLSQWLGEVSGTEVDSSYLAGIAERTRRAYGVEGLREVLSAANAEPAHERWFRLEFARALQAKGEADAARLELQKAIDNEVPLSQFQALLEEGFDAAQLADATPNVEGLIARLLADPHMPDEGAVARYVTAVLVRGAAGLDLSSVRSQLEGEGWYRRWLRFVLELGRLQRGEGDIVAALAELAADTAPFVGKPRACDMYGVRHISAATLRRALSCVAAKQRVDALEHLLTIASGTTTYLEGSPSGPFTLWALLETLLEYPELSIIERVEHELTSAWRSEYYDYHAETSLFLARLWTKAGQPDRAVGHWRQAARFLAGYGFHKDVTVFGLIEAIAALDVAPKSETLPRLHTLQALVDRALRHSDGKETRHGPRAWFDALVALAPQLAARSLAWTILRDQRVPDRTFDGSIAELLKADVPDLTPLQRFLLWRTLPAESDVDARLDCVAALLAHERPRGEEAFYEAAAMIDGDSERLSTDRTNALDGFATRHGLRPACAGLTPETRDERTQRDQTEPRARPEPRREGPFLPKNPKPLELLVALRGIRIDDYDQPIDQQAFAAELETVIDGIRIRYGDDTMIGLLEDFSRRQYLSGRAVAIELVAGHLRESSPLLAAEIYVLAWCGTRSSWDRFGGPEHRDLLDHAFDANRGRALERLAREIAHVIEDEEYALGVSRRIVEALVIAGDEASALAAWDAAFDVVAYRLPQVGPERSRYVWPEGDVPNTQSAFGELAGATLAQPEFARRDEALGLLVEMALDQPDFALAALRVVLARDATFTDALLVLRLLEELQEEVDPLIRALREELESYARSSSFRLAETARRLLARLGEDPPRRAGTAGASGPLVSQPEVAEAIRFDYGGRCELYDRVWNRFSQAAARRYWRLWRSSRTHEAIRREQAEAQWSRVATWVPPLEMHDWCYEIFEIGLDGAIDDLRTQLIRNGRWQPSLDDEMRFVAGPDVAASAARARSRIVRPVIALPSEREPGSYPPSRMQCGIYCNWLQVALWEREIVQTDRWRSGTLISVCCGLPGQEREA